MLNSERVEILTRYVSERPLYEELAEHVDSTIQDAMSEYGIPCTVTHRVKDVRSLAPKLVTRSYDEIGDKAGVRVVVHFPWMLKEAEELVKSLFWVVHIQDKRAKAAPHEFAYRATHFQVTSPAVADILRNKECEIQVLTRAENLWADTEHDIIYKYPINLPNDIKRSFYRLVGHMEIFDSEVMRVRDEIDRLPEARLLSALEPRHRQFVGRDYDGDLSGLLLGFLIEQVMPESIDVAVTNIVSFMEANQQKLERMLARYENDDYANPLMWQPELPAILYCLDNRKAELQAYWEDILPFDLLDSLAIDWDNPVYQRG